MASSDPASQRRRLLRLAAADNVAVAVASLSAGETCELDDQTLILGDGIGIGHKVALRRIGAGEKITKWNCPIGSATRDIQPGEHVHVHNLRSDYLPTFTLESGNEFVKERH